MKVKLLVNLKIADSSIIGSGSTFEGEKLEDFPDYIRTNLNNPKVVKILQGSLSIESELKKPVENPKKAPALARRAK
jgi:hypothetical protein